MLLGVTDGVTEALSPNGKLFTQKQLLSILKQPADSGPDLVKRIQTNVFNHIQNAAPSDDITMLTVQRLQQ
jgi:sigma-B regulation protein RsbU (phosphoserine phosphatase)